MANFHNIQDVISIYNAAPVGAFATSGGVAINSIQNIYTGFAPEMLHKPIETVLDQFRQGNKEVAKGQLKILRDMGGQDPKILPALDVVTIYLNLLDVEETGTVKEQLKIFLAQQPDNQAPSLLNDLCLSALLRLANKNGGIEEVRTLWTSTNSPGLHAKESFYALAATADELEAVIDRVPLLTAIELRGVVEGAIRADRYQVADAAMKYLAAVDNTPPIRFLKLCVKAGLLQTEINSRHFWCVTASVYDELIQLAHEAAELILLEPLPDSRLPVLAARLFIYLRGGDENLAKSCWIKLDLIEKVHSECAAHLRFQNEHDTSGLNETAQRVIKAQRDENFRNQHIQELLLKTTLPIEDAIFLIFHGSHDALKRWLDDGGICEESDETTRDFITLRMHICSVDPTKDREARRELKDRCKAFFDSHGEKLSKLNPDVIIDVASQLNTLNLPFEACQFLEPLLPPGDYSLSPLLKCYIDTLICADKNATLATVLDGVPTRFWSRWIWQVRARCEFSIGNFLEAKASLQKAAGFGFTSQIAVGLIDVISKLGDENEVPKILSDVPDTVLSIGDRYSQRVIMEMFKHGFHNRAEKLVLNEFISGPESKAIAVTNIFTSLISLDNHIPFGGAGSDAAVKGVKYFDGKVTLTKLVVSPEQAQGQYLLSSSSPLGDRLLKVATGESFKEGLVTYRLEERLPAIVAAYRISLHIRDIMNAGNDCFHMFHVSDDPNELVKQLQEIISPDKDHRRQILEHESLPVMFKGHLLKKSDAVGAALTVLSDSEAKKHPLPDLASKEEVEEILLDVYAGSYLALTGLTTGLLAAKKKIYVTLETETFLRQWLSERQRDTGGILTTLPNGRPHLLTTEDIRRRTQYVAGQMQMLLNAAQLIHPALADMPPEMLDLREYFDASVFSTLRTAFTRKIPWLCIDLDMAKMADSIKCPVVKNCLFFITTISELTPFTNRKNGIYRHAFEQLPFPLRHIDLLELSHDKEAESAVALSKLLRQYPNAFENAEQASQILTDLFLPVLAQGWNRLGGIFAADDIRFPSEVRLVANSCFYVASHSEKENTAEYNFALCLQTMISRLVSILGISLSKNLIGTFTSLGTQFLIGHFMSIEEVNESLKVLTEALTRKA